jgi:hypothetical protein
MGLHYYVYLRLPWKERALVVDVKSYVLVVLAK